MKRFFTLFYCITTILITEKAMATLQVFPTRVVLNEKIKNATLTLRNKDPNTVSFKVSSVFYRMGVDGSMTIVDDVKPEERSAQGLIKFSPKRVSLKANEEQVVRILSKIPQALPDGDYRIHIKFTPEDDVVTEEGNSGKVTMKLQAKVAVAISVIVQNGKQNYKIELKDFSTYKGIKNEDRFKVRIKNIGSSFPIGTFTVLHKNQSKKEPEEMVGIVRGVNSYITERWFDFPMDNLAKRDLSKGEVSLQFNLAEELDSALIGTSKIIDGKLQDNTVKEIPKVEVVSPMAPVVVAAPVVAAPVVVEPVVAEPVVAEPVVAEPVVAEPVITVPVNEAPMVKIEEGPKL
jgi:P pilus assembly chaperone PapD